MNTCKTFQILLLSALLAGTGCSGIQQPTPTNNSQDEATTAQSNNAEKSGKGQLELLVDKVVSQAQQAMRSRTVKLKDIVVEATPMWSLNYQGEVHVRVYDASGNLILDEYRK